MSSIILFYLLMLSTITVAKTTADRTYKIIVKNNVSRSVEDENLRIILNYVRSKQIFSSSIFCLVSSDDRSNVVHLLSKYIASESIVSYKITTNNFSRKYTWQSRVDLTWIFIIDSMNILDFFVHKQSHIWKAVNQYLIIVTTPSTISSQEIFQTVWKIYGVYRIVIISIEDDFRCLRRYLPFEKNQQNKYGVIRKICLMDQGDNVELYTNFENLNGYPIHVVMFSPWKVTFDNGTNRSSGIRNSNELDTKAKCLLEQAMRTEFHITELPDLVNSFNGSYDPFHRALQYIEDGESEIIIISFFVHQYEGYRRYEFTASLYEDKLCLIAPTAGFVPKSHMPIMSFASNLWVALAIYNILVSVLWFLIKYYSVSFRRRKTVLLPLTKTTGYVLSQRSTDLPLKIHPYVSSCFDLVETSCYPLKEDSGSAGSTTAQRAFLIGTLFFGLIVTSLYQSCLMFSLSNPFHYPELNTLEDVACSNFTIITKYNNLKKNTFLGNTPLDKKLRDGNDLLHIVEECPTTFMLSYIMRLHSPYRERINGLLLRMQQMGFVRLCDLASFSNERSTTLDDDKNLQASNIEEISKLVRRAISRDLENWNTLEEYLDRTVHRPQLGIYSREINKNGEDGSYMFPVNRKFVEMDSPKRSSFEASLPQKLDVRNAKERPMYFEEVDTSGRTSEMSVSGTQAVDIPSPVDISDSLPPENIFQPRPQMVRYKFFKKPMPPRLDKQNEKPIDQSTPRTYGDDLIREEITNDTRDRIGENVKVTSIEISEQPRHKTRHHHGEFPHRHRSQSTAYPTIS
ncbi:hypothetical protein ALC56_02462 [Trachymyrmex septentrionalis]|uniref:Ionotropic glutamate receptor C-terminal domain-containing protein n=1 Tax=Trachymyrmex septentrionalis TaxID=34720 RepID=A0A151K0A3_9HYME|nr:hypothetical protein ALC56_02462 [Trachymyrmex septentrionalis]